MDPRMFAQFPFNASFLPNPPKNESQATQTGCDAAASRSLGGLQMNVLMENGEVRMVTVDELVASYQRTAKLEKKCEILEQKLHKTEDRLTEMARKDERKTARVRQQLGIINDMEARLMEAARKEQERKQS